MEKDKKEKEKMENEMDWSTIDRIGEEGKMWELLKVIPQSKWNYANDPDYPRWTVLDATLLGNNPAALAKLLQSGLFNVKDYEFKVIDFETTIAYDLAEFDDYELLQVVCAAGAYLTAMYTYGYGKMFTDTAFTVSSRSKDLRCAKLLIASGCRIEHEKALIKLYPHGNREAEIGNEKELQAFQDGVVECRKTVIALLVVKRRQNTSTTFVKRWVKYDRYIIHEIAKEVWVTRSTENEKWQ